MNFKPSCRTCFFDEIGPGTQPDVEMGPLVNAVAMSGVARYVEAGRKENANFCTGGERIKESNLERGFFFQPTVIEATPEMEIAREEIFGPVLSVIRARGLREAIEIANAVRYGLTASIFTRDVSRVFRFADRAQAGIIHVNRPGVGGYSQAVRRRQRFWIRRSRSRRRGVELLY